MDLMVALSTNDRNAESASLERLASKLSLCTAEELKQETLRIQKLFKERWGISAECQQQVMVLLDKFKRFLGFEENQVVVDGAEEAKKLTSPAPVSIPNEFLCPITLEIMTDPVIVATGQVYFAFPYTVLFVFFSLSFVLVLIHCSADVREEQYTAVAGLESSDLSENGADVRALVFSSKLCPQELDPPMV